MTTRRRQRSFPAPAKLANRNAAHLQQIPDFVISDPDEDVLGDKVAQEILRENRLKQDQRIQNETKDRLGSIQDRISRALSRYDLGMSSGDGGEGEDFKLDRKQSEQAFDVYILGFNESAEKKSKLLESLYNFFLIYEEEEDMSSPVPQIDLESSYESAVTALSTASASLERLATIHDSLIDGYSTKLKDKENKRKTKKLELSFRDAQNELVALKDTLETTTRSLNETNVKAEGLRKTLDMKASELEKNKMIIEKLRKQTENLLGADEKKMLKERTELLGTLEKENTELKIHLAQLEFSVRKSSSHSAREENGEEEIKLNAAEELIADLQNKMSDERDRHEEALRLAQAGAEAEFEEELERKKEEFEMEMGDLKNKIAHQESTIMDLENKLAEATRLIDKLMKKRSKMFLPVTETPPVIVSPSPEPTPPATVIPAPISERTTSAVSVDPTEALNKKYKELEEEYERKRSAVEEEMTKNDEQYPQNQWKLEELKKELHLAKDDWLQEKTVLEDKVESFRKMVAEMEADALEKTHRLAEMLKERKAQEEIISSVNANGSQDSEEDNESDDVKSVSPIRPTTAFRNAMTPGPDNPVITQVVTMYDHVTDFKEKLIEILSEIQSMGVIDGTETMLMIRSMEQINTVEFSKEGDIHLQIEGIQASIAQVMHSSEKTVHKIFKKLSKERSKIEKLSWVGESVTRSPTKSSRARSVAQCDRATSPIHHFGKPMYQPPKIDRNMGRRPPAQYTAMFAHTDLEHNKRSLKQAVLNHKITPKQYEEVVAMMLDYTNIPQKRLHHLAKHYISHARMQIMEENIQMNRPVDEDIDDVLSRLDELYLLRKTRYGVDMDQLAAEREDLAYLLTKQLDRLENQSGIFLIKPYIAYKAHTLKQYQRKKPVFLHQARVSHGNEELEHKAADLQEPGSGCHGNEQGGPTWDVGASRTEPVHDWTPDIPKLLEMDCNRITVARNTVSQPADVTSSPGRTIKSFVVVRASKSTGSFRPKSTATSTAEFLSMTSDYKSEEVSFTTSDNLPPLRSGYTSGFVSTSNSRQRLAPIMSPPSNIKVEKAATVT